MESYELENALSAPPAQQGLSKWQSPLIVGPAALDILGRRVMIEDYIVHQPAQKAAIIEILMRHAGRVM